MQEKIIFVLITIIIGLVVWIFQNTKKSTEESINETQGEHGKFMTKEIHVLKEEALWQRVKAGFAELKSDMKLKSAIDEERWKGVKHSLATQQTHTALIMERLGIIEK